MMRVLLPLVACMGLLLSACKKEPGVGGKSEIRGYVYQQEFNSGTCQPMGDPYPSLDARVFIMYGDHDYYDDDVRTGPGGLFVFSWLRKGDYRVYAIGECGPQICPDYCPGGLTAVYGVASVNGKDEVANVGIINVKNF